MDWRVIVNSLHAVCAFQVLRHRREDLYLADTNATICSIYIHKLEKRREILAMMAEIPAEYVA